MNKKLLSICGAFAALLLVAMLVHGPGPTSVTVAPAARGQLSDHVLPGLDKRVSAAGARDESVEITRSSLPGTDYVLNTNSMKIHRPDCSSVKDIADRNIAGYHGFLEDLIALGYEPCKRCNPE